MATHHPEPLAAAPQEQPSRGLGGVLVALFVGLVGLVTVAWTVTLVVLTLRLISAVF